MRLGALLALLMYCQAANGFPAPRPNGAPTNAEMIVGTWEEVLVGATVTARFLLGIHGRRIRPFLRGAGRQRKVFFTVAILVAREPA